MIELAAAMDLLFGAVSEVQPPAAGMERVSLAEAAGRVLCEDVQACLPVPLHDYSAMDGYAVCASDLSGSAPWTLAVSGECRTGHPAAPFQPGAAVRIFTGAALPPGADAVVMQENTSLDGERVVVQQAPRPGEHVRRAGEDLRAGDVALPRGTRLSGYQVGLLAAVDRSEVLVARRPQVGVFCTGDELRPAGNPGGPGLAESNGVALVALARQAGGAASAGPLLLDDARATRQALEQAVARYDVVLTVGGVSVGDHDLVRPTLIELGAEIVFAKVAIRPGKPVMLARLGRAWVLGLPGNPASAQVTFSIFGMPLLRALQGDARPQPERRLMRLAAPFRQKPGRLGLYRGRTRGVEVELFENQASGAATAIAWANCFVVMPSEVEELPQGASVEVLMHAEL
jgi:molybdopterin molybdotransferase